MANRETIEKIMSAREPLRPAAGFDPALHNPAAEGGCGVIGIACSERIAGRHLLQSLDQMRNRGNGKGGGIAAVGLVAEEFGVSQEVLEGDYLLVVAYLDTEIREEVEKEHIYPSYEVDHIRFAPHLEDHTVLAELDVRPPEVYQYFVRLKPEVITAFKTENGLAGLTDRQVEDEVVYQNSYRLNAAYYAATGEKQAFVLSHGKNMLVLKMVGYGDDVIRYYQLEDLHAHVWIGHHRYPTKGKVWHPGGAHPFVGVNEALVHNGDFANYASIGEYLAQRNIYPLFLTDTEVSVLVFDLLHRVYDYPLEYVIEALAPTTERDFTLLPAGKRRIYEQLQTTHMHCSPDGPWFFLIAQSAPGETGPAHPASNGSANGHRTTGQTSYRLIGITDTSMLRPQVFAWQQTSEDGPAIGFAASEKQGIDAALSSLAAEDQRFWSRADRYWNARGGSHTDGGAFLFSVYPDGQGSARLIGTDKFGREIRADLSKTAYDSNGSAPSVASGTLLSVDSNASAETVFDEFTAALPDWTYEEVIAALDALVPTGETEGPAQLDRDKSLTLLTMLIDGRFPTGKLRRSSLLSIFDRAIEGLFANIAAKPGRDFTFFSNETEMPAPAGPDQRVLIDARGFAPEGDSSLALAIVRLVEAGYRRLIVAHARGHRFIGNGLSTRGHGVNVEVYGSSGDYLASGIDGMELIVHGNAQDQLAQIMKSGKLVVHGDVGQTFMYAAKGGEAYILGNAAGRPLINAVGKPRVVINGTCLDYLAESFMAGDPFNGGGFVILNGIKIDDDGHLQPLETPYPGGNLFSLASGGALYIRDPERKVTADQLNGGEFASLTKADWELILPYLQENQRLFNIPVDLLLEVAGETRPPGEVYRKVRPTSVRSLQAEEAWVSTHD